MPERDPGGDGVPLGAVAAGEPSAPFEAPRATIARGLGAAVYVVAVVALWWAVVDLFAVSPLILPSPPGVWQAATDNAALLVASTAITLGEALLGFGTALVIGVAIAVAIVSSRLASRLILPALVALNSAPKVVIAPVLVIWLGFGIASKIGMALLLCFFPIVINAVQGLSEVEPDLIDLYRLMQASRWVILRKVRLPNAVPYILSGLKIALPLAIIGAVIGEFVAARQGVGYQIMMAYSNFKTELVFAAVILVSFASVALFQILQWIEQRIMAWRPRSDTH
jgi:NitT/TauT family transport system permease protein